MHSQKDYSKGFITYMTLFYAGSVLLMMTLVKCEVVLVTQGEIRDISVNLLFMCSYILYAQRMIRLLKRC